eukprot:5452630-Pleurochrysis_carterae.AAC.2
MRVCGSAWVCLGACACACVHVCVRERGRGAQIPAEAGADGGGDERGALVRMVAVVAKRSVSQRHGQRAQQRVQIDRREAVVRCDARVPARRCWRVRLRKFI